MGIAAHITRLRAAVGHELLLPSVTVLPVDDAGRLLLVQHAGHDDGWGTLLMEMTRRPNVALQVVSAVTGAYQDGAMFWQFIEDEADMAVVASTWDAIKSDALPRGASLQLLEEIAETWT